MSVGAMMGIEILAEFLIVVPIYALLAGILVKLSSLETIVKACPYCMEKRKKHEVRHA